MTVLQYGPGHMAIPVINSPTPNSHSQMQFVQFNFIRIILIRAMSSTDYHGPAIVAQRLTKHPALDAGLCGCVCVGLITEI